MNYTLCYPENLDHIILIAADVTKMKTCGRFYVIDKEIKVPYVHPYMIKHNKFSHCPKIGPEKK